MTIPLMPMGENMTQSMDNLVCPECGSDNVAKILWGMPAMNDEFEEDLAAGRVVLGGCCISSGMPEYRCNACGAEFGAIELDWVDDE